MRRFIVPFLLLFILMALTVKQATPQRAAALYDHPNLKDAMVSARADKLVDKNQSVVAHVPAPEAEKNWTKTRTKVETDNRRLNGAFDVSAYWTSPHEGTLYVSRGEGRWHRGQAWRRSS